MNKKFSHLKIQIQNKEYQYSLLKQDSDITSIVRNFQSIREPFALYISEDEVSMMAPVYLSQNLAPEKFEAGWSCFRIVGSMPFGTVQGLISNISSTLIKEQIGVCVASTFKSDWFFIRSKYLDKSVGLLTAEGWNVEEEPEY